MRLVKAEILKLVRRRGTMIWCLLLTIGSVIVTEAILLILHAANGTKHGPAGGTTNLDHLVFVIGGLGTVAVLAAGVALLRAGRLVALPLHGGVMCPEIVQVVRRHRTCVMQYGHRQAGVVRNLLTVLGDQVGQHVPAVHDGRPFPGQVIEADVVEHHQGRIDAEQGGEVPLEPDRHVA